MPMLQVFVSDTALVQQYSFCSGAVLIAAGLRGACALLQVRHLHETLRRPFTEQPGAEHYLVLPPERIRLGVEMLSCSS